MERLETRQNDKYIKSASYRMAVILLTCHICFAFWYWIEGIHILFFYNLISIGVFTLDFVLIRRDIYVPMVIMNYAEITVFMTLNTLLLGWEYGFQYYTFGLLVSAFMIQVQMSRRRKISPAVTAYAVGIAIIFILMRIWLLHHGTYYPISPLSGNMYIVNAALVLSMLIGFTQSMLRTSLELEKELSFVAGHDMLTGLPNRRTIGQSIAGNPPEWLAIMDLDLFKGINDRYGHYTGDEVLRTVGELLKHFSEETGATAGRYGGEEFILYGSGSAPAAIRNLEQLRAQIESTPIRANGETIHFTSTFGLAVRSDGADAEDMLHIADVRLYRGKEGGRNRIIAED